MSSVSENLKRVRERVARAAARAGRDPSRINIVAVTKTVPPKVIQEAVDAGIRMLGENRVQEMMEKMPLVSADVEWHMIGRLQTNKVKYVIGRVALIHSLDRWSLAEEIQSRAEKAGVRVPVLVQVNVAGEPGKAGLEPSEVVDFIRDAAGLSLLDIKGLMTIAPLVNDPEEVRPVFRQLRVLAERVESVVPQVKMSYLSMGMSGDFEVAVEEGSNMLRLGTVIFGARKV